MLLVCWSCRRSDVQHEECMHGTCRWCAVHAEMRAWRNRKHASCNARADRAGRGHAARRRVESPAPEMGKFHRDWKLDVEISREPLEDVRAQEIPPRRYLGYFA